MAKLWSHKYTYTVSEMTLPLTRHLSSANLWAQIRRS